MDIENQNELFIIDTSTKLSFYPYMSNLT